MEHTIITRRQFILSLLCIGAAVIVGAEKANAETTSSYTIRAEKSDGNCPSVSTITIDFPANLTQREGQIDWFVPNLQPERLVMPMRMRLEKSGSNYVGTQEDRFSMARLGVVAVQQEIWINSPTGVDHWNGKLEVRISAHSANQTPTEEDAAIQAGYGLPCRIEYRLEAQRVQPVAYDQEKRIRLRALLKEHTDLLLTRKHQACLEPLDAGLGIEGDHHVDFYWRKARALYLASENGPLDKRIETFQRGIDSARSALAIDPQSGEGSIFLAINLGRLNTSSGFMKTIMGLEEFEKHCLKAIADKATNNLFGFRALGDAHHTMGIFYRLVPDSWFVEMLLGTRGSLEKSIQHHRDSLELQPRRGDYLKELGLSLVCQGQREEDEESLQAGQALLDKALATEVFANDPEIDKTHIRHLLANPDEICNYSRDQY